MNDLTTLPQIQSDDGFALAAKADPDDDRLIAGIVVKFVKGAYPTDDGDGDMTEAVLAAQAVAGAWQKWHDNKLVSQIVRAAGQAFPERSQLDDLDQRSWQIGTDDKRRDPWQLSEFLYLADLDNGQAYTFISGSIGGRRAIKTLSEQIRNKRMLAPGVSPLVRLDVGHFHSPRFGAVACPKFTVTGWLSTTGETIAPTVTGRAFLPAPVAAPEPAPPVPARRRRSRAMPGRALHDHVPPAEPLVVEIDDEIPF